MEALNINNTHCTAQSTGAVNQLFALLIQTLLAAQCEISPEHMWPKDYGPTAVKDGKNCSKTKSCRVDLGFDSNDSTYYYDKQF